MERVGEYNRVFAVEQGPCVSLVTILMSEVANGWKLPKAFHFEINHPPVLLKVDHTYLSV